MHIIDTPMQFMCRQKQQCNTDEESSEWTKKNTHALSFKYISDRHVKERRVTYCLVCTFTELFILLLSTRMNVQIFYKVNIILSCIIVVRKNSHLFIVIRRMISLRKVCYCTSYTRHGNNTGSPEMLLYLDHFQFNDHPSKTTAFFLCVTNFTHS